jgi:hypothetical protein
VESSSLEPIEFSFVRYDLSIVEYDRFGRRGRRDQYDVLDPRGNGREDGQGLGST